MSVIEVFLLGYLLLSAGLLLALWQAGTGRRVFERAVRADTTPSRARVARWRTAGSVDASLEHDVRPNL